MIQFAFFLKISIGFQGYNVQVNRRKFSLYKIQVTFTQLTEWYLNIKTGNPLSSSIVIKLLSMESCNEISLPVWFETECKKSTWKVTPWILFSLYLVLLNLIYTCNEVILHRDQCFSWFLTSKGNEMNGRFNWHINFYI